MENLEEKLGATKHLLQNGRTVVDIERNASYCISSKRKKEFDTQISKETQISAIISDTDEDSDEDRVERKPCIWHFKLIFLVKDIYFLFLENIYKVAGQQCD